MLGNQARRSSAVSCILGVGIVIFVRTTKSRLSGLSICRPRDSTDRPSPQYPVCFHEVPECEPPLGNVSNQSMAGALDLHGVNECKLRCVTEIKIL